MKLQIIPTGHDTPLPRRSTPHSLPLPSHTTPRAHYPTFPTPTNSTCSVQLKEEAELDSLERNPYQVFWDVYKPVTKIRKSARAPPDFRIVVIE